MNNSSKHLHYNALSHMGPSPPAGHLPGQRVASRFRVESRPSPATCPSTTLRKDRDTAAAAQGFQLFWGKTRCNACTQAEAARPCGIALQTMRGCACSFHLGFAPLPVRSREPVCEDLWAPQPLEASQLHNGSHRPYINKTKMNTLCASKPQTLTLNFT